MPASAIHCPFLNRTDERCAQHFNIDNLNHAFEHCFGRYHICPTYLEMLLERRARRSMQSVEEADALCIVQVSICGRARAAA